MDNRPAKTDYDLKNDKSYNEGGLISMNDKFSTLYYRNSRFLAKSTWQKSIFLNYLSVCSLQLEGAVIEVW